MSREREMTAIWIGPERDGTTSRPWEVLTASDWSRDGVRGASDIFGVGSGQVIGHGLVCGPYMDFYDKVENFGANALLIVEAVNNYDRLRAIETAARRLIEELRPREEDGHLTYAVAEPHTLTALQAALDDLDA